jgi:hypothetical protein
MNVHRMIAAMKRYKAIWIGALCVISFVWFLRCSFPLHGWVYPAKRLDAVSQEIVQRALRMKLPQGVRFDHVTMIHGKDSTLFASAMIGESDLEPFLKSVSFETSPGKVPEAELHNPDLPWWNFKVEEIHMVLREVAGSTEIVVVKSGGVSRVFILAGSEGKHFPADLWPLFQQ